MADWLIKTETLPSRCEICHQSDLFDAANNRCHRCEAVLVERSKIKAPTQSPARFPTLMDIRVDPPGIVNRLTNLINDLPNELNNQLQSISNELSQIEFSQSIKETLTNFDYKHLLFIPILYLISTTLKYLLGLVAFLIVFELLLVEYIPPGVWPNVMMAEVVLLLFCYLFARISRYSWRTWLENS